MVDHETSLLLQLNSWKNGFTVTFGHLYRLSGWYIEMVKNNVLCLRIIFYIHVYTLGYDWYKDMRTLKQDGKPEELMHEVSRYYLNITLFVPLEMRWKGFGQRQ